MSILCIVFAIIHNGFMLVFLGKWIVTPEYLLDSLKFNDWLPEGPYEVNLSARSPGFANPVKAWREKVARGVVSGAFQVSYLCISSQLGGIP